MDKLKKLLFSEDGMRIVNMMFFLSLLFRNVGLIFIAYIFWIIYLVFCIKNVSSRSGRIIYRVFIGHPPTYFDNRYEDEWITDPLSVTMIKDIGNSEVNTSGKYHDLRRVYNEMYQIYSPETMGKYHEKKLV